MKRGHRIGTDPSRISPGMAFPGLSKEGMAVGMKYFRNEYMLYLFVLPAAVVTVLFFYLPMFMNITAFMDYKITAGWLGLESKFVGFHWFRVLFGDPYFYQIIWRTIYYSSMVLLLAVPGPLILALLLNELFSQTFKRIVQSISYLPHFVSWVTIASLAYLFLTTDTTGIVNNVKVFLFGGERIIFMRDPVYFPFVLALSNIFKTVGWGTIIYLAAIASVDQQLYESATVDGANRWHKVWHITLPSVLPTIVILFIFALGSLFGTDFEMVYNMQNPIIRTDTNTINVYAYYKGVLDQQISMATAMSLFQSAINAGLLVLANTLSKKVTSYSLY